VISHKGVTGIFVIKFSQAISHVNVRLKTNVSENNSVSIIRVDETELVSKTLVFNLTLTKVLA